MEILATLTCSQRKVFLSLYYLKEICYILGGMILNDTLLKIKLTLVKCFDHRFFTNCLLVTRMLDSAEPGKKNEFSTLPLSTGPELQLQTC